MKHIIKLSLLFVTMSMLTSSREDTGTGVKVIQCLNNETSCLRQGNDYAVNISCQKAPVVQEKKTDAHVAPVIDNEVSLSPISRFIMLQ